MTVSLPFAFNPIIRKEQTRKAKVASSNPIANRNFKATGFVAESNVLKTDDETLIIAQAWIKSPQRTIIALGQAGLSLKEICGKVKYNVATKDGQREWDAICKDAQALYKKELAEDSLAGDVPDEVMQQVQDADGQIHTVDIAAKLKKAVIATLFSKSDTVKISAMKGAQLETPLSALFGKSVDSIAITKRNLQRQYSAAFRTRDTQSAVGAKVIPLPAHLQAVLKAAADREAEAAAAAAPAAE